MNKKILLSLICFMGFAYLKPEQIAKIKTLRGDVLDRKVEKLDDAAKWQLIDDLLKITRIQPSASNASMDKCKFGFQEADISSIVDILLSSKLLNFFVLELQDDFYYSLDSEIMNIVKQLGLNIETSEIKQKTGRSNPSTPLDSPEVTKATIKFLRDIFTDRYISDLEKKTKSLYDLYLTSLGLLSEEVQNKQRELAYNITLLRDNPNSQAVIYKFKGTIGKLEDKIAQINKAKIAKEKAEAAKQKFVAAADKLKAEEDKVRTLIMGKEVLLSNSIKGEEGIAKALVPTQPLATGN